MKGTSLEAFGYFFGAANFSPIEDVRNIESSTACITYFAVPNG